MQTFADVVHALSWRICAEVASCVRQSFIVEVHPGAGDVLSVRQRTGAEVATVDRAGLLRAGEVQLTWADVLRLGTLGSAQRLLRASGNQPRRRDTTPARRTYRVVAQLLESRLPDAHNWQVRSAMFDSTATGPVLQQQLTLGVPELAFVDPYQVWSVQRDGVPVLALCEGNAYYADGHRMTVMEAPSSQEHFVAEYLLRRLSDA